MIEKTIGFKIGDQFFGSLEEAQHGALKDLFMKFDEDARDNMVESIMAEREKILDILTTTPNSKPTLRKINGAKRKRAIPSPQTARSHPMGDLPGTNPLAGMGAK